MNALAVGVNFRRKRSQRASGFIDMCEVRHAWTLIRKLTSVTSCRTNALSVGVNVRKETGTGLIKIV
eukprot:12424970-Karenia_brevis.AAC.1